MSSPEKSVSPAPSLPQRADLPPERGEPSAAVQQRSDRREARRWWIKLILQPVLLLAAGALLLGGLGWAQHLGWIHGGGQAAGHATGAATSGEESVRYICPMMCTPPQSEPGRCPVCAMELVPATSSGGDQDSESIQIDPAARRVSGIATVTVKAERCDRAVRAIGELSYDEGTLKTISAYVDGRIERLYADYTGMLVQRGDHLALIYSPRLYSGQVEFLLAKRNSGGSRSPVLQRIDPSGASLQASARQRLIEYGMTDAQIAALDGAGQANSRLHVCAPISGTVIEKLAAEGDYVKEGQPIYRLADLSTVWLMLELFPDDAAAIGYGQKVEATVQSLPGRTFTGRVAFIDPNVDPTTRTVGVRVVIPNPQGQLRVGDYAKATMHASPVPASGESYAVYDPELANKWIGPRHPHVVQETPGTCPICGVTLVPAARYGFTANPTSSRLSLTVPRDAVLMVGDTNVVYVEVEPGRFEIRRVILGPSSGERIAVLDGLSEGEQVAVRGNFLIDSQMQLAGNPSLIDPSRLEDRDDDAMSPEVLEALAQLSDADRVLAEQQRLCPVSDMPLGSMGAPIKVDVNGTPVFICCEGCRDMLLNDANKYLAKLNAGSSSHSSVASATEFDSQEMDLPPMDLPVMAVPEVPDERPVLLQMEMSDNGPALQANPPKGSGTGPSEARTPTDGEVMR